MFQLFLGFWIGLFAIQAPVGAEESRQRPQFAGQRTLLRPTDYREWIFLSSSLGIRYAADPDQEPRRPDTYHNIYINPAAYREFVKSGKFPDGTMLVLELMSAETKREPGLQGSYQKELVGLEASVKDTKRFEEAWAYFSFDGPDGTLKSSADPFPKEACWSCHHEKARTDHVFTQFYPLLRYTRR